MTPTPSTLRSEGERRRDAALSILQTRKDWLVRHAQCRMMQAALGRDDATFTSDNAADDLAAKYDHGGKWIGAAVRALAEARLTVETGRWVKTCRPFAHGRKIPVWCLVDRAAAAKWLAFHPEIAPPEEPATADALFGGVFGMQRGFVRLEILATIVLLAVALLCWPVAVGAVAGVAVVWLGVLAASE